MWGAPRACYPKEKGARGQCRLREAVSTAWCYPLHLMWVRSCAGLHHMRLDWYLASATLFPSRAEPCGGLWTPHLALRDEDS